MKKKNKKKTNTQILLTTRPGTKQYNIRERQRTGENEKRAISRIYTGKLGSYISIGNPGNGEEGELNAAQQSNKERE